MNAYWFRPHRYGLGASPKTWEGWALTGVYLAAIFGLGVVTGAPFVAGAPKPYAFIVLTLVLTLGFVFVCWRKTEGGWRWRWGKD